MTRTRRNITLDLNDRIAFAAAVMSSGWTTDPVDPACARPPAESDAA